MAGHLPRAVRHVNDYVHRLLPPPEQVLRLCAQVGHRFRRRTLGPAETVLLCVVMVLRANASLAAARVGAAAAFSAAALCKARARLPLALLEAVARCVAERGGVRPDGPPRVLLVDACNYYLPDARALRRHYRHPRQKRPRSRRCDYPQVRVLGCFDLHTGLLLGQLDFPSDRHESPLLGVLLARLLASGVVRPGDTLVFDRGFCSFANFCLLRSHGVHFVARLPATLCAKASGRRRFLRARGGRGKRGVGGAVVWDKPARRPGGVGVRAWRRLPASLEGLRQLDVRVGRGRSRGRLVLLTDLPHAAARQLAEWYRRRWEVETNFRHLKRTLDLEFLTTRSVQAVRRELLLRQVAYNLVRLVMLRAARGHRVACGRIGFADAVQVLLHGDPASVLRLLRPTPARNRTPRPRRLKYRGKNYRSLTKRPVPQRKVA
jgi:hypothetical protein